MKRYLCTSSEFDHMGLTAYEILEVMTDFQGDHQRWEVSQGIWILDEEGMKNWVRSHFEGNEGDLNVEYVMRDLHAVKPMGHGPMKSVVYGVQVDENEEGYMVWPAEYDHDILEGTCAIIEMEVHE